MRVKRPAFAVLAAAFIAAIVSSVLAFAPAEAGAPKVLILDTTVSGGAGSIEATRAASLGFDVDLVDATAWAAMDAADFGSYEGIILGDPNCTGRTQFQAAVDNADVWGPVIDGNTILIGTDPVFHAGSGGQQLTELGVDFALDGSGDTGLYLTLSCFGGSDPDPTTDPVVTEPLLAGLGDFVTRGTGCDDDIHIVATHPAIGDLEDENLADWGCSTHEGFIDWPKDEYLVLALAIVIDDPVFTAADGTQGNPYILANGEGLEEIRAVNLEPNSQTHDVGGSCDLTATAQFNGVLANGADITFEVLSGPHAGETGTDSTDANGEAVFSYEGTDVGTDVIMATWDRDGTILESDEVTCTWTEPPTTTTTTTTAPPAPAAVPTPAAPTFTG